MRLSEYSKQPVTLLQVINAAGSGQHVRCAMLSTNEFHRGLSADAPSNLQALISQRDRGAAVARVAQGRPVTEILRAARNVKAQLIVIGATRRNKIGSTLFGKTGQLLRDAKCPVLGVPAP